MMKAPTPDLEVHAVLFRRLPITALLAVALATSACSASGSDASQPTTTQKTSTSSKTTTSEKTTTSRRTTTTASRRPTTTEDSTTTSSGNSDDDVTAIAGQLKGGDFTDAQATCFAEAFVADASPAGVKAAATGSSDPTDLSPADLEVFKTSTDQCIDLQDLADAAAKGALDELDDTATLTGDEGSCISDGIATQYRSSGEFLVQILTNSDAAQQQVSSAIGACLQPDTLKALITKQIGDKVDPAVADCVAQGIIDQNGGTAGAFTALSAAGSGGDSAALEAQVTSLAQSCLANPGG